MNAQEYELIIMPSNCDVAVNVIKSTSYQNLRKSIGRYIARNGEKILQVYEDVGDFRVLTDRNLYCIIQ